MADHELFYLKMQWRRMSPGKHQTIYSFLFENTSAVVYSEDTLGHRCTSSNGPNSRVWFGKKFSQKAEIFKGNEFRSKNGYLKLKNILEEDAGTYLCSVKSSLLHREVTFQLSVKGEQNKWDMDSYMLPYVVFAINQMGRVSGVQRYWALCSKVQKSELQHRPL